MTKFAFGSFLALLCVSLNACTHVEYTRSWVSGQAQIDPEEVGAPVVDVEDFSVNEIALKEKRPSYSYTYNVAAPVAGLSCGAYYRWGSGDTIARGGNADPKFDNIVQPTSVGEFGFLVEDIEHSEAWSWMVYSFRASILLDGR